MDVSPARQVDGPVRELVSVSRPGPREGTTRGGLVRGAHTVAVDLPSQVPTPECKARQRKRERAGQSGKKREIY